MSKSPIVYARNQMEMDHARGRLTEQAKHLVATHQSELDELTVAIAHATKNKWNTKALKAQAAKVKRRVRYYLKLVGAFDAGYVPIPDMDVDVQLVRTKARRPPMVQTTSTWGNPDPKEVPAQCLDQGEGTYRYVVPAGHRYREDIDGKKKRVFDPTGFQEMPHLPLELAKPELIDAMAMAQKRKLMDEIGLVRRGRDPMIVGRIKEANGWSARSTLFLIAWYMDLRDL